MKLQLLGIDFSSAPSARKPITVAVGRLEPRLPLPVYRLSEVRELPSLTDFEVFLAEAGGWVGGFDLPFGQPRALIESEGWPTHWATFVRSYVTRPRASLREVFRRWCDRRPPGDKFAWRKADRPAGSSPAMRWTNPPVAWMMHAGIGRMLDAGLVFPAHRHPRGVKRSPARATVGTKIALEAYPAFTARQACHGSYKSDSPASWNDARRDNRRRIVAALRAGTAGLAIRLVSSRSWLQRLVDDGRGDLLDAVICGLQAGHAARRPDYGLPRNLDPLEGWIASVPPPRR